MDISEMETQKFTSEQSRTATRALRQQETSFLTPEKAAAPTEKTPSVARSPDDTLARINALLKYSPSVKCYVILQQKIYIRVEEIAHSIDETHWHCTIWSEREKGTVLTIPAGGPLMIYIDT